jgi:hypothetical protein
VSYCKWYCARRSASSIRSIAFSIGDLFKIRPIFAIANNAGRRRARAKGSRRRGVVVTVSAPPLEQLAPSSRSVTFVGERLEANTRPRANAAPRDKQTLFAEER